MYILVDRENMKFLHKHPDPFVLCNVAWLENAGSSCIFPIDDAHDLREFTNLELKLLYSNTTGNEYGQKENRNALLQIVYELASRIEPSDLNAREAEEQASSIEDSKAGHYKYVRGAKRPVLMADLFNRPFLTVSANVAAEKSAAAGNYPALAARPKAERAAITTDKPATDGVVRPAAESGPKRGTAKAIIWDTADEMWEAAGKPTDKPAVLELRKRIMDRLETEEAIKRASASSELGNWHKARAPF